VTAPRPGEAGSLTGTLRRLEEIVRALEGDEPDLDRALALFEEGVALLRVARERVAEAELRVQRVLENASGDLKVSDLDA
jgi:exodeoxyribonuclease VII small subunit